MEGLADLVERIMDNPECVSCEDHPATVRAIYGGTVVDLCRKRQKKVKITIKKGEKEPRRTKIFTETTKKGKTRRYFWGTKIAGCDGYIGGDGLYHALTPEQRKGVQIMARQPRRAVADLAENKETVRDDKEDREATGGPAQD
jgi:hypothetical protein